MNPLNPRKPIIGLAGGIGSGKSLVARLLAQQGCAVMDADAIAKAQLDQPSVRDQLVAWWGRSILDDSGQIDRAKVASIIFDDPTQRHRLEQLIHPLVHAQRQRQIALAQAQPQVRAIVLDVPLLFEVGLHTMCDRVIYVHASRPVRLARVAQERGWEAQELERREKTQLSLDKKLQRAHDVVENSSSEAECFSQVRDVLNRSLSSS